MKLLKTRLIRIGGVVYLTMPMGTEECYELFAILPHLRAERPRLLGQCREDFFVFMDLISTV